jgi:hypothetical protein
VFYFLGLIEELPAAAAAPMGGDWLSIGQDMPRQAAQTVATRQVAVQSTAQVIFVPQVIASVSVLVISDLVVAAPAFKRAYLSSYLSTISPVLAAQPPPITAWSSFVDSAGAPVKRPLAGDVVWTPAYLGTAALTPSTLAGLFVETPVRWRSNNLGDIAFPVLDTQPSGGQANVTFAPQGTVQSDIIVQGTSAVDFSAAGTAKATLT